MNYEQEAQNVLNNLRNLKTYGIPFFEVERIYGSGNVAIFVTNCDRSKDTVRSWFKKAQASVRYLDTIEGGYRVVCRPVALDQQEVA